MSRITFDVPSEVEASAWMKWAGVCGCGPGGNDDRLAPLQKAVSDGLAGSFGATGHQHAFALEFT
jgi:hypothetical protein